MSKEKKQKSPTFKYDLISKFIIFGVVVFLFLLSFIVLGMDFHSLRTTSFWATFLLLLMCSELVYKAISYVNKEKQKETKQSYIDSNNQYNELVNQYNTNYARQEIDEWAKDVNKVEKYQAYRMYLEEVGLCLDDLKLTRKQVKNKYRNDEEEKLDRHQLKVWKKCKLNLMPYEKLNTSVLLYDRDSFGKSSDKFGTDEASYHNQKKRDRMFTIMKIATTMLFVIITIDTLKEINLESIIKYCIYLIAIASAYATALINSSLFIKDRIIEFGKRSATLLDFFRYAKDKKIAKFDIYEYIEQETKEEDVSHETINNQEQVEDNKQA